MGDVETEINAISRLCSLYDMLSKAQEINIIKREYTSSTHNHIHVMSPDCPTDRQTQRWGGRTCEKH